METLTSPSSAETPEGGVFYLYKNIKSRQIRESHFSDLALKWVLVSVWRRTKLKNLITRFFNLVRMKGLEPSRPKAHAPKAHPVSVIVHHDT